MTSAGPAESPAPAARAARLYRAALDGSVLGSWPPDTLRRLLREVLAGVDAATAARALDRALQATSAPRRRTFAPAFWPPFAGGTLKRRLAALDAADAGTLVEIILATLRDLEGSGRPGLRRQFFAALVEAQLGGFVAAVTGAAAEARTVVFVSSRTDYKPLREARALGAQGVRCFLVHLEPLPAFVEPLFDATFEARAALPLSPLLLACLVARLRPAAFHVHCAMWHYVLSGVVMDEAGDAAVVCEYNDITSFYSRYDNLVRQFAADDVDLDIAMERRALAEADLIVHQCAPRIEGYWRGKFGGTTPMLEFQPYPMTEWAVRDRKPLSAEDGVVRMVWAGQVPGRVACPPAMFDAYYLGEAVEQLLQQGFGVVAYQNPMFTCDFADPNFAFYGDLAARYPQFSIRPGVRLDRLAAELSQYDFGVVLFAVDYSRAVSTPEKRAAIFTNKVFTYLESGIPAIVPAEYESMAAFVTEHGFGFAVRSDEIGGIARRVAAFDMPAAKARIAAYQREHCMEREVGRLIEAYDEAVAARARKRR